MPGKILVTSAVMKVYWKDVFKQGISVFVFTSPFGGIQSARD